MINNTFVTSVNGKTGEVPYELDYMLEEVANDPDYTAVMGPTSIPMKVLFMDADEFKVQASGGNSIYQELQHISQTMRPLILEQIGDSNNYIMHLDSGIPFTPAIDG